jgi:hypothetical protein
VANQLTIYHTRFYRGKLSELKIFGLEVNPSRFDVIEFSVGSIAIRSDRYKYSFEPVTFGLVRDQQYTVCMLLA